MNAAPGERAGRTERGRVALCVRLPRAATAASCLLGMATAAAPAAAQQQNPSPMVESTRSHERLAEAPLPGARYELEELAAARVRVFVPAGVDPGSAPLLIHFHGAAHIPEHAAAAAGYVVAVVHAGSGGRMYDAAFSDPAVFTDLRAAISRRIGPGRTGFSATVLSGFSAGYGAIRAILRDTTHFSDVSGVLLLDGLHTSYEPAGVVLHDGGRLDTTMLEVFERFARAAVAGRKRMLITHSEIFPGTFASTTETADHLLAALGLTRTAVLRWGPVGMQQLSHACAGRLAVLGFAGNSAPDHVDHFHGMPHLLALYDTFETPPIDACAAT